MNHCLEKVYYCTVANIISAISGRLSKSLTLGTLLPTTVFVILNMALVGQLFPGKAPLYELFRTLDLGNQWRSIAALFWIVLLGGLLYALNSPIIRFYEGYPWQNSWIGKRRTKRYQAEFNALYARWKGFLTLQRRMDAVNHKRVYDIQRKRQEKGEEPRTPGLLPFRYGIAEQSSVRSTFSP